MPEGEDDTDAICSSFLPPHTAEVTFYKFIREYFVHMLSKLKFKQITKIKFCKMYNLCDWSTWPQYHYNGLILYQM